MTESTMSMKSDDSGPCRAPGSCRNALRAGAGEYAAARTTVRVALHGIGEADAHLIGERCYPRDHVAELVELTVWRSLAHRLRKLADLLAEPRNRGRHAACAVTFSVGALDDVLKLVQPHPPHPTSAF